MQPFEITLNGLTSGTTEFQWHADGQFFESFDNSEVLGADLMVTAEVEKSGNYIGVDCSIDGSVTVQCDRCLDDLEMAVETGFKLSVKFGPEAGNAEADDVEIVMLPYGSAELDLSQIVYDYVLTSLPLHRVHPDGECNPDTVCFLSK